MERSFSRIMNEDSESRLMSQASHSPGDWWKDRAVCAILANLFQKHIVGLHVFSTQNGKRKDFIYTGFLLDFNGYHLWVTAGHVIGELETLLADDRFAIHGAEWCDGYPTPGAESIRVEISDLHRCRIEKGHIDVGLIWLRPNIVALLDANEGIQFVTPQIWTGNASSRPEGYFLVGVPDQFQETTVLGVAPNEVRTATRFPIVCLPVERIAPCDKNLGDEFWGYEDAFYGRVVDSEVQGLGEIDSIEGMSGGPLLSIERGKEGSLRYRLYAIQSCWKRSERIIRGTPIEFLDSELRRAFGNTDNDCNSGDV